MITRIIHKAISDQIRKVLIRVLRFLFRRARLILELVPYIMTHSINMVPACLKEIDLRLIGIAKGFLFIVFEILFNLKMSGLNIVISIFEIKTIFLKILFYCSFSMNVYSIAEVWINKTSCNYPNGSKS